MAEVLEDLMAAPPGVAVPVLVIRRPAWMARAACRGLDPDVFFPRRGQPTEHARQVCAGCPVVRPCREFAMADGQLEGIWAGTSPQQRRELRPGGVVTGTGCIGVGRADPSSDACRGHTLVTDCP